MVYLGQGTSSQKFYILSLTHLQPGIWSDTDMLHTGLIRHSFADVNPIYLWDLHRLAALCGSRDYNDSRSKGRYFTIEPSNLKWNQLWVENINDDSGSNIYQKLDTGFAVNVFTKYSPKDFKYKCDFSFSPLMTHLSEDQERTQKDILLNAIQSGEEINFDDWTIAMKNSETYNAEFAIWQAMTVPGYPLLAASSIPEHSLFGPLFLKSASISAGGQGSLGDVKISVQLEGGRVFRAPIMPIVDPNLVEVSMYGVDANNNLIANGTTLDYRTYRAASILDCMFNASGAFETTLDLRDASLSDIDGEKANPEERLIAMELSIAQTLEFEYTPQEAGFIEQNGPKYVSVTGRLVTGSLTFLSRKKDLKFYDRYGPLTLYFGGVFLFPMDRVHWQRPKMIAKAGAMYAHEVGFIAQIADGAVAIPQVSDTLDTISSEFRIPLYSGVI